MHSPILGHRHGNDKCQCSFSAPGPSQWLSRTILYVGYRQEQGRVPLPRSCLPLTCRLAYLTGFWMGSDLRTYPIFNLIFKWGHSNPVGAGDLSKVFQRIESNMLLAPMPHAPSIGSTLPQSLLAVVVQNNMRPKDEVSQKEYISSLCEINDKV